MKKNEAPGWLISFGTILVYTGLTRLLKLDVKLGLLLLIAYYVIIDHVEKEDVK